MLSFPDEVSAVLSSKTIRQILSTQEPVHVESTMTAVQASSVLAKHGISSAPIRSPSGELVGMFDFATLAELLLAGLKKTTDIDAVLEGPSSPVPVGSKLDTVEAEDSVLDALSMLLTKNLHRAVVLDSGKFVGMISFSDIVKFINGKLDKFLAPTVEDLGLANKPVATVGADRPVLEAFTTMVQRKLTSLAVVEHDGSLLTAVTLTDCKNLVKFKRLDRLRLDCREFAAQIRATQSLADPTGAETFPFFAAHPNTPLKHVIAKLVAVRTHRLFVVDHGKPIGVIDLYDVCRALANP